MMSNKVSGVYSITNTLNGKQYIGSAVDIRERWRIHVRDLSKSKHHSAYLQRSWDKYGRECFTFAVVELCGKDDLIRLEQFYIDNRRPVYNTSPRAGSQLGYRHTTLAREKMSSLMKGKPSRRLGATASAETRAKISTTLRTPEVSQKLSAWQKGIKKSDEHRAKLSVANTGKKHSKETLAKMSASAKGKTLSAETREKISIARRNRKEKERTVEHSANIAASIRAWWKNRKETKG